MRSERLFNPVAAAFRRPRRASGPGVRARGYTILELMIVMTILGVLLGIAIAAYQDYSKRTKMIEVMLAAGSCRNPVFEAYYHGKRPPAGQWGCESPGPWGRYVASIVVDPNGKVSVTTQNFNDSDLDGTVLTLTPLVNGLPAAIATDAAKKLDWRCGHVPDGTTVPPQFLPSTCKAVP